MGYRTRLTRKRIQAIPRGPDGSAFQTCDKCGVSVAIALVDMHDCESKNDAKRFKPQCGLKICTQQSFQDQPRSAFRFFTETFEKNCNDENQIDIDRKCFETWKNMSKQERQPYILQADKVELAYVKALLKDVEHMSRVEDEADSAEVGKYDENYIDYEYYYDSEYSDDSESYWIEASESFDTYEWLGMRTINPMNNGKSC